MMIKDTIEITECGVNAKKFLLELNDGCTVEIAGLDYSEDFVICMSCQVGCLHACTFCANRIAPYIRNLTAIEICDAVTHILPYFPKKDTVLDFSGIGDCSDNWTAVRDACISLKSKNIIQRYSFTSISPQGWCSTVSQELKEGVITPSKFMISLHGYDLDSRRCIIPNAEDPRQAVSWWAKLKRDGVRVVMNYVLHSDNTDKIDELLEYINIYANWIDVLRISPINDVKNISLKKLANSEIESAFTRIRHGVSQSIDTVLFHPVGIDRGLACGQMRARREQHD